MKPKYKTKRLFKVLMASLIAILYSPILPVHHSNVEAAAGSKPLTYKFDGFSSDALTQFSVNGAAAVPDGTNFIRLVPTKTRQSGAVFNKNTLHSKNNYSFSTGFSFSMSNPSAVGPSDGLTFTIQTTTTSQWRDGGSLGYYGITPSFAVKYDTFLNPVYRDPSANYVGIAENGSVVNQDGWYTDLDQYNTISGTNYVLSNGTRYYTWIDYDGLAQNVQVRLGTSPDRASSNKILDVNNIDLGAIFGGTSYYAGFTAATGDPNYENHDLYSWYFVDDYAPIDKLENQRPTATDDTKTTTVNTPVSGQVSGTDPDGDSVTFQAGNQPSHGTVTVNTDGTWTYTPNAGFIGDDTFTVIVDDGHGGTIESTITVHVNPSPPSLESNKTATIQQKAPGNTDAVHPEVGDTLIYTITARNTVKDSLVKDFVISDILPDGLDYVPGSLKIDGVSATDVEGDDMGHYASGLVVGQYGNITDTSWHTLQFQTTIKSGQAGNDIRNVAVVNGGNIVTPDKPEEVLKVNPSNLPPIVPNFEESTWKNTTITGSVYGADPDGNPLTFAKGTNPQHGTVTVNPDGTWEYIPDSDYVGQDSFTVTVSDGKGGTTTSTVKVNVTEPPNRPPTVPNYLETATKNTPVTGSVYGTDPDGDPVTYTKGNDPKYGRVTVNPDGTWTYVPNPGYVGPDMFTVTVSDGKGGTTTSTITIDVTEPSNRPPTAPDYNGVTTEENTSVSGSVKGTDPDDDSLTYTKGSDPQHGTVTVNPDGTWTYVPNPGYVGPDSFTVIVSDGKGGTVTTTVTVNVTEKPNHPPAARNESVTTPEGTSVTGSVKGTDPDGDPLTYTKGSDPQHGTVTVNPDGTWAYVPNPGHVGPDSFTVIVSDGKGGTVTTTVTVNVTEKPNQPPTVQPSYNVTTPKDTSVTGSVYGKDPDGDPLTYTKGSDPQHGTVRVNPDGTWTYVPNPGYVGQDSFTVTVSDGRGGTTTTTVTVIVTDTEPDTGSDDTNPGSGTNPDPVTPNEPSTGGGNETPSTDDGSESSSSDDGSGNGTTPAGSGNGTSPTGSGNGTTPAGSGNGTTPAGSGNGTTPAGSGNGTTPAGSGNGTTPAGSGNGTSPTGSGNGTTPAGSGNGTPSVDVGNGATQTNPRTETPPVHRGVETPAQEKQLNQLPNTAANFYNLGAAGLAALVAGLVLMRRKNKA